MVNNVVADTIIKILEFAARYSIAVAVVCAFILFTPEEFAKETGVFEVRKSNTAVFWITLIFSSTIFLCSITKSISPTILKKHQENNKTRARYKLINSQLDCLSNDEIKIIKWCLKNKTSTVYGEITNTG